MTYKRPTLDSFGSGTLSARNGEEGCGGRGKIEMERGAEKAATMKTEVRHSSPPRRKRGGVSRQSVQTEGARRPRQSYTVPDSPSGLRADTRFFGGHSIRIIRQRVLLNYNLVPADSPLFEPSTWVKELEEQKEV